MITLKDVYKIYYMGDNEVRAADGINIHIEKGEFVAIVGQSGSGKSTCMNIIGCLDTPTEGTYLLNGIDVSTMDENELFINSLTCACAKLEETDSVSHTAP